MRKAGILFPISSLPSRFGIGCFSKEAYDFVDFLAKAGQSVWQILPLGPTGFGDSPYQSASAFAGNPYFVDPVTLIEEGYLTWDEANSLSFGTDPSRVDYGALYENRMKLLSLAARRFFAADDPKEREAYRAFLKKQWYWLDDYAMFQMLKKVNDQKCWTEWETPYLERDREVLRTMETQHAEELDLHLFVQYEFQKQWDRLHAYAREKGVEIVGDMPYYVALDSADAWAHPECFDFDEDHQPVRVAGCPPDAFSPTGQLWGNPVYNWTGMKQDRYAWWIRRLQRNYELMDVIRIDHFNGFDSYYAVPAQEETAENGELKKGPGIAFFREVKKQLGDVRIIAEDLGTITPSTEKLLAQTGFPGMKVLQYAFDWTEYSYYMTHNHIRNCVVYTGTHDNKTTLEWIEECSDHDRDLARRYIHSENTDYGAFVWDFIREAYRSVADLCIVPLQDYLVLGKEARINTPGTQGGNWQWRLLPNVLSDALAQSIHALAKLYCRIPPKEEPAKEKKEKTKKA
ncbi:MAG: 4-alpha-glucanotransferase [Firmicutes bacterium]|nr:4-alpha-glucanotransferase [Bacillota bacterium]